MSLKIMLVDDAAIVRTTLRDILTKNNFDVVGEAQDGQEAIKKFVNLKPDLVIMDITMPVMNGIEATREIKKIDPEAKILICSVLGQKRMILDAFMAGAEDFLVKPFKKESVLEKVSKYL
ncbi:MAG: response regulator [Clostridia bacterium]|nr:response regulator [Clostridia bacterium]